MAHEGVPLVVIQRQLGHANVYLQGIDSSEIISTVLRRPSPTISATAGLQMTGYVEGRPGRTGPRWPTRGRTSAGELADAAERFCETCFAVGAVLRAALLRNELFPSGVSLTRRRYHGCCSFRGLRAPLAARLRVRRSASRAGPTVCQPVCERCRLVRPLLVDRHRPPSCALCWSRIERTQPDPQGDPHATVRTGLASGEFSCSDYPERPLN
jgi:hypothetical protein